MQWGLRGGKGLGTPGTAQDREQQPGIPGQATGGEKSLSREVLRPQNRPVASAVAMRRHRRQLCTSEPGSLGFKAALTPHINPWLSLESPSRCTDQAPPDFLVRPGPELEPRLCHRGSVSRPLPKPSLLSGPGHPGQQPLPDLLRARLGTAAGHLPFPAGQGASRRGVYSHALPLTAFPMGN